MSDFIELIERARSLEGDLRGWLEGLAAAAAPLLGEGHGASALAFHVSGGSLRIDAAAGSTPDLASLAVATNRAASAAALERVYRSPFVAASLSEVLGAESPEIAPVRETSGGRFRDTLGIVAPARAAAAWR